VNSAASWRNCAARALQRRTGGACDLDGIDMAIRHVESDRVRRGLHAGSAGRVEHARILLNDQRNSPRGSLGASHKRSHSSARATGRGASARNASKARALRDAGRGNPTPSRNTARGPSSCTVTGAAPIALILAAFPPVLPNHRLLQRPRSVAFLVMPAQTAWTSVFRTRPAAKARRNPRLRGTWRWPRTGPTATRPRRSQPAGATPLTRLKNPNAVPRRSGGAAAATIAASSPWVMPMCRPQSVRLR